MKGFFSVTPADGSLGNGTRACGCETLQTEEIIHARVVRPHVALRKLTSAIVKRLSGKTARMFPSRQLCKCVSTIFFFFSIIIYFHVIRQGIILGATACTGSPWPMGDGRQQFYDINPYQYRRVCRATKISPNNRPAVNNYI